MLTQAAQFEFVLGLVAVVLILEIVARRTGLLPSAVLVVGGVVLALAPGVPDIHLDADLIRPCCSRAPTSRSGATFAITCGSFCSSLSGPCYLRRSPSGWRHIS
jgi:hypothetical protein